MISALVNGNRTFVDEIRDKNRPNEEREGVEKLVNLQDISDQTRVHLE